MNFQILPNKAKSIGLGIFIICFGMPVLAALITGVASPFLSNENSKFTQVLFNPTLFRWLNILSIVGMLIYILSKERIEDEFITKLRLESYQIALMLCLGTTMALQLIDDKIIFNISYVAYFFIFTYLITFYLKKRYL